MSEPLTACRQKLQQLENLAVPLNRRSEGPVSRRCSSPRETVHHGHDPSSQDASLHAGNNASGEP